MGVALARGVQANMMGNARAPHLAPCALNRRARPAAAGGGRALPPPSRALRALAERKPVQFSLPTLGPNLPIRTPPLRPPLRLFISSPSDLAPERKIALQRLNRLAPAFKKLFTVAPVL